LLIGHWFNSSSPVGQKENTMTLENIERLSNSDIDRGRFLKGLGLGALSLAGLPAALSSIDSALAASGGEIDNFTWALEGTIPSLNFFTGFNHTTLSALTLCMEGLAEYTANLKVAPRLATSWTQPNPTTYIYKVRPGVKFWDGTVMTADDVAFSMAQQMNPKVASQESSFYSSVASVVATGPLEVTVKLKNPDPAFQYVPAFAAGYVVSKKFLQAHLSDMGTPSVLTMGTGPYKISKFQPDQGVTLVRNDLYWGPKPRIKQITLQFITDPNARLLAMRSHSVDGASLVPLGQISQWKAIPNVRVVTGPGLQTIFFTLDVANPPFNDIHVRRAFAYALDKQGVAQAVFKGYAQPANAMVPPEGWANLLSKSAITKIFAGFPQYAYDLTKAKAELAQSAMPKGFTTTVTYPDSAPELGLISQILARGLSSLNITLNVKEVPATQWLNGLYAHSQLGIGTMEWNLDYPDPQNVLDTFLNSQFAVKNAFNLSNFKNAKVDSLLAQQKKSTNNATRGQLMSQIEGIVADQLPVLPVAWGDVAVAMDSKYNWPGFNGFFHREVWINQIV
jgi:peptide/nickel transport system substrate-binding protein